MREKLVGYLFGTNKQAATDDGPLCCLAVFLVGIVAHASRLFDPYLSFDSVHVSHAADAGWQIELGRFFEPIYHAVISPIASTWLSGILSMSYLSLAAFFAVRLLGLRTRFSKVAVASLFATCQVVTILFASFVPYADTQTLAWLLATVAAYLWHTRLAGGWRLPVAAVMLTLMLGLYQAYVGMFTALVMLRCVCDLLDGNGRNVFADACVAAGTLLVGGLVYYACVKMSLLMTGRRLWVGTNGLGGRTSRGIASYLSCVPDAWLVPAKTYLLPSGYLVPHMVLVNWALGIGGLVSCVAVLAKRPIGARATAGVLVILLLVPLGMNIVYVASQGETYELMEASFILIYLFEITMFERLATMEWANALQDVGPKHATPRWRGLAQGFSVVAALLFCLAVWNGVEYAHGAYALRSYDYRGTMSTCTRLIDRLEQLDGYEVGETPRSVCGQLGGRAYGAVSTRSF